MSSFVYCMRGSDWRQCCLSSIKTSESFVFISSWLLLCGLVAGLLPDGGGSKSVAGNTSPQACKTGIKNHDVKGNPLLTWGPGAARLPQRVVGELPGVSSPWISPLQPEHREIHLFPLQFLSVAAACDLWLSPSPL